MVAALLLVPLLAACDVITGATVGTSGEIDYTALGMNEREVKQWEELGIANVDTAEKASVLAGFQVAAPTFLPDPLEPASQYMVRDNQAGLKRAGMETQFGWRTVTAVYALKTDRQIATTFVQSNHAFSMGPGEPNELCGRTISVLHTPEGQTGPGAGVVYVWEKDGIWYGNEGILAGVVDEADVEKMVCSIKP
jgi:hypothetical protein